MIAGDAVVSGSTITANPGTSWMLLTVPRISSAVTLDVGPIAETVAPDGT